MQGRNGNASGQAGVAGQRYCKAGIDSIPERRKAATRQEAARKWNAVRLYCAGLISQQRVSDAFANNAHWRPL